MCGCGTLAAYSAPVCMTIKVRSRALHFFHVLGPVSTRRRNRWTQWGQRFNAGCTHQAPVSTWMLQAASIRSCKGCLPHTVCKQPQLHLSSSACLPLHPPVNIHALINLVEIMIPNYIYISPLLYLFLFLSVNTHANMDTHTHTHAWTRMGMRPILTLIWAVAPAHTYTRACRIRSSGSAVKRFCNRSPQ